MIPNHILPAIYLSKSESEKEGKDLKLFFNLYSNLNYNILAAKFCYAFKKITALCCCPYCSLLPGPVSYGYGDTTKDMGKRCVYL